MAVVDWRDSHYGFKRPAAADNGERHCRPAAQAREIGIVQKREFNSPCSAHARSDARDGTQHLKFFPAIFPLLS
jgi:hypothetical protein